ncbi:MAG TPA: tRNA lysidine(34) synthetase TilS [Verrucomicrobiae bacterium]|nr:tRNA lysidine(34) synthetase TilS [Verrucomicrobiae bacterium]
MLAKIQPVLANLLAPGEPLLAGVSGGPDSVTLLDVLVQSGWRPHVCHLNHKLRGADSDADAEFVRDLAGRYDLPCTVEARAVDRDEDAARRARFDFFTDVALRTGIKKLALAHTADDQVETFLFRLLRGAGVPGLVGIWPERQMGPLRVIRPLLRVRRTEVLAYLRERGLPYREDASNADTRFTRNRIRHELLPLLEREYNPAIRDVLLNTAEILRDEDFYLLHHVAQRFYMAVCQNDTVNVKALANCPTAVQRRLLRFWLGAEDEHGPRYSFEQIEAVRQLALGEPPSAQLDLPGGLRVCREYDTLKKAPREEPEPVTGKWPVKVEGETLIRELRVCFICHPELVEGPLSLRGENPRSARNDSKCEESFDADGLGAAPFVRTWQEGDRFQPLGMDGEKKLQDFFVDEKVPRRIRGRVPLLCAADGRIAWVVGHRIAEPFKVGERTRRILRVHAATVQG